MKKLLVSVALAAAFTSAQAVTFFYNGVLMGTVCRSGLLYTAYNPVYAQPVGSSCPVRNNQGYVVAYGVVTDE